MTDAELLEIKIFINDLHIGYDKIVKYPSEIVVYTSERTLLKNRLKAVMKHLSFEGIATKKSKLVIVFNRVV